MATNPLKGRRFMYDVSQAPSYFTPREARAEYARLRAIAEKRLQRLGESPYRTSDMYRRYKQGFAPLPRSASEGDIYKALFDVSRFVSARTSSVSGQKAARRRMLETLQSHGYDFINARNIDRFGEFWREVKKHSEYRGYDSEEIVELFHVGKEKRVDPVTLAKDLEFWIGNEDLLDMPRSTRTITADEARERLGI